MSAYDNDRRVKSHPDDGSWMVFDDRDNWTEYNVHSRRGVWNAFDAFGHLIQAASGKATKDDAIRALIGDPR